MKTELHPAKERGHVQQGWLDTWHSFSFGSYQNPKRQGFGALLVLNDDTIAPGKGFGSHPHEEMEIITIPIKGSLEHKDSTGKGAVLKPGDVQVMSAGTGLLHSEFNASKTEPLHLFQIWIQPSDMAVKPRHAEKHFAFPEGKLVTVAGQKEGLFINQDASVKLGNFKKGGKLKGKIEANKGVFFFVVEGKVALEGKRLGKRDALALSGPGNWEATCTEKSQVLVIDVPLSF